MVRRAALADPRPDPGGFLAGLSIYQGEFDYGVPQFELVLQPLMIRLGAIALVAARVWIGKGGALGAVAWYLLIRGGGLADRRADPRADPSRMAALCARGAADRGRGAALIPAAVFGPVAGLAAGTIGSPRSGPG